jgi:hypothetical protein
MSLRKQEEIMKIVISGVIIIVLGVVAVYKNHSEKKNIQPANGYSQESYSK